MPENAPEVYFYDKENYIYGREAIPEECLMWKEHLMKGCLNFLTAKKAIETLVKVHNECSRNEDIKKLYADKEIFYGLRISPYFEFVVAKYPELEVFAKKIIKNAMENCITLVHGDFSPKNIMVTDNGISVLDFEVAHYGHPAFDLAFFSAHFLLKGVKYSEYWEAYWTMLKYMLKIYFEKMDYMDRKQLEKAYIEMLSMMLLARIDGKSPVEYLVGDTRRQQLVRDLCFEMIDKKVDNFNDFSELYRSALEGFWN